MSKASNADGLLSAKLHGLRELQGQLKELGAVAGVKVLARDARKAMKPTLERARAKVPVDTGLTRDNLQIRVQKPKKGNAVVIAGLAVAKTKESRQSKHKKTRPQSHTSPHWRWHFIELGTATQPARPFIRPAFSVEGTVVTLKAELGKEIRRIVKRRAALRKAAKRGAGK